MVKEKWDLSVTVMLPGEEGTQWELWDHETIGPVDLAAVALAARVWWKQVIDLVRRQRKDLGPELFTHPAVITFHLQLRKD